MAFWARLRQHLTLKRRMEQTQILLSLSGQVPPRPLRTPNRRATSFEGSCRVVREGYCNCQRVSPRSLDEVAKAWPSRRQILRFPRKSTRCVETARSFEGLSDHLIFQSPSSAQASAIANSTDASSLSPISLSSKPFETHWISPHSQIGFCSTPDNSPNSRQRRRPKLKRSPFGITAPHSRIEMARSKARSALAPSGSMNLKPVALRGAYNVFH